MSDHMWQTLTIGGDPGEHRDRLMELVDECGFENAEEDGIHLRCDGDFSVFCETLGGLKEFLRKSGMSYDHHMEGKWDYDGGVYFWRLGQHHDGCTEGFSFATQSGNATVQVDDLMECLSSGLTLEQAIERHNIPELPVFVSEVVTANAE